MPDRMYRIGTSGWIYPHWRERFYPADLPTSRWFDHYAGAFDTVEINYTFYRLPEEHTFDEWHAQAPPGFLYAVKASRFLTHRKKLNNPEEPIERLLSRARHLREHLGPILFQLPPRWKRNAERLRRFCGLLPGGLTYVFEFRDPDWLADEIYEILEQHGMSLCLHDKLFHPRPVVGPIGYVRLHGGPEPGGGYPPPDLQRWADLLREITTPERPCYIYFNNDLEGHAIRNALQLRELLQR